MSDALPGTAGRRRIYLMRHGEVAYFDADGRPTELLVLPTVACGYGSASLYSCFSVATDPSVKTSESGPGNAAPSTRRRLLSPSLRLILTLKRYRQRPHLVSKLASFTYA